ncbi:MAG TPA: spore coat protein U domain-containing protein [bacterium]|nr:spore coat protein U domain-containing protein [bacterium]
MMKKIVLGIAALALGLSLSSGAYAGVTSGSMPVTANIQAWCALGLNTLDLGDYAGTAVSVSNDLYVLCSKDSPYNVAMDAGLHFGAGWRRVSDGTNFATYGIFKAGGAEWGDNDFANTYIFGSSVGATGTGTTDTHTMTAYVLSGQAVPVGTYTDTVLVSVYF